METCNMSRSRRQPGKKEHGTAFKAEGLAWAKPRGEAEHGMLQRPPRGQESGSLEGAGGVQGTGWDMNRGCQAKEQ